MAFSYVAVTLVIVLLLESVVVAVGFLIASYSPLPGYWAMQMAGQAAEVYALQAALRADGSALDPATTFAPDEPAALRLREAEDPPQMDWFSLPVQYFEPGARAPERPVVALLIDASEQVLASTYPDRFPAGAEAGQVLPQETALIRDALAGRTNGAVRDTRQGQLAAVAHPVMNAEQEVLGAVLVQTPAGGPPNTNLLLDVGAVVIPSGLLWLCLMLPIGMVFGVLSTRGLIKRIERLASATARFKEGDLAQRVPVRRADEIGQLEMQFNEMAEQLVESFEQRQALTEQSARREERARIEQEMKSAHYIQKSLLPEEVPDVPGWEIKTFYQPAAQVGGDLYDFLALPDGRIGIVIGDANGKGMSAALIMTTAVAMLRAAAPGAASPGQVLALVNNLLHVYIPSATFVTCFYAILDPTSGRLCCANAGHSIPYMTRGGQVMELRATGMPLGLMPEQAYEEEEFVLAQADRLLFYTDGLIEAHDGQREIFGTERLKRLLARAREEEQDLVEATLEALEQFTGRECEQEDDVTMLVLNKRSE